MEGQDEAPQRQPGGPTTVRNRRDPRYALYRLQMGLRRATAISVPEQRNERLLYTDMIFQALLEAGPIAFVAVYLVRLGAADWLVGLQSSLPALVTMLAVLPAGAFVQKRRDLIGIAKGSHLSYRICIALMAMAAFFPNSAACYIVVLLQSLASAPGALANVSVTTILGVATTPTRRPKMLSTRWAVHGLFSAVIGFLAGQWLDWAPFPRNYQLLFVTSILAGLGSWIVLGKLRLPALPDAPRRAARSISVKETIALVRQHVPFRNFLISDFVLRIGTFLPMALFSIYKVRDLGSSDAWLGVLLTVERVLSVVTYLLLSRYGSRPWVRKHLWLGCLGVSLYPISTAIAETPQALLLSSFISGTFFPAMNLFLTDTLYAVSPEEHRPTFVATDSFAVNLTAFVAPLAGTWLAGWIGIRQALVACTIVRALGVLVMWQLGVTGHRRRGAAPVASTD
ncbi:MAG: MFS transporter [Anaerolineales bacterium]